MTTETKSKELSPLGTLDTADEPISISEMEELVLKHEQEGINKIRSRGQIETARELRSVAFSNIADLMYEDDNGVMRMHKLTNLPRHVTASIKKIKIKRERVRGGQKIFDEYGDEEENYVDTSGEIVEIELWDKPGSLDKLMRHYGGYEADHKQKSEGTVETLDLLLASISDAGAPSLDHNALPAPLEDDIDDEDEI